MNRLAIVLARGDFAQGFRRTALPMERAQAESFHLGRDRLRLLGELASHGRGQDDHPQARRLESNLLEQSPGSFHSSPCVDITLQVMTVALQSTGHQQAVDAFLEGPQQMIDIEASGARNFYDL